MRGEISRCLGLQGLKGKSTDFTSWSRYGGFKTVKIGSQILELAKLEKGLFDITKNIKYRNVNEVRSKSEFQKKLQENSLKVKKEERMFIKADKSSNYYLQTVLD